MDSKFTRLHGKKSCCIIAAIILCVSFSAGMQPVSAQDVLKSGFNNPPPSAKLRIWWHWVNGNVSRQGITADLEAMKRVGIQEAQIQSGEVERCQDKNGVFITAGLVGISDSLEQVTQRVLKKQIDRAAAAHDFRR